MADLEGKGSELLAGLVKEFCRFRDSVDWNQSWLWGLGAYYVVFLLTLLITRRRIVVQGVLFAICLLFVPLSQPLNTLARTHWKVFASANYFGENGFFVSIMFGIPHILLAIVALINLLILTGQLAIQVKQMQFKHERKEKAQKETKKTK
jgi:hypothetical protein